MIVQLKILSGKRAGVSWGTRRFPVRIGRSTGADLQIDEPGVWEHHLTLISKPREGFFVRVEAEALASVNGEPIREAALRNGDTIDFGSGKLQFWIADPPRSGLRFREWLTWATIATVSVGQVLLVYWLLSL